MIPETRGFLTSSHGSSLSTSLNAAIKRSFEQPEGNSEVGGSADNTETGGNKEGEGEGHEGPSPSFWRVIIRCTGTFFMTGGLYKLVYDVVSFLSPQVLK